MLRLSALIALAGIFAACSAAPQAAPASDTAVAPTPIVIYVTPAATSSAPPTSTPSVPVRTPRPTATAAATPGPLAAHILDTLDEIQRQSDVLVSAANAGGGPEVYLSVAAMEAIAARELEWLAQLEPSDPNAATDLRFYESALTTMKGHLDTIITDWVGVPPAGDYDGPAAFDAGQSIGLLLRLRSRLQALPGGFSTIAPPAATASPTLPPTAPPTPVAVDFDELRDDLVDGIESELEFFISRVQEIDVSSQEIHIEFGDNNWVRDILKRNQWTAIESIADEIYGYGDYWGNITPSVTIRSTSGLGGGSLTSVTSASQLREIYELELSESDWYREADFKVRGKLY